MSLPPELLVFLSSYLIGSISGGVIIGKIKKIDIRSMGSKSAGATNALRTGNKVIGYSTLILDILKAISDDEWKKDTAVRN